MHILNFDTIGFSRMEIQFQPNCEAPNFDTIGFSRMEIQFQPNIG